MSRRNQRSHLFRTMRPGFRLAMLIFLVVPAAGRTQVSSPAQTREEHFDVDWDRMGVSAEIQREIDRPGLRDFLVRHGGEPPEGTEVFRHRGGGILVRSSREYLQRLDEILPQIQRASATFSIRAVLLEIKDWPPPGRDPTQAATVKEILALPEASRRVAGDLQLLTRSGQNAQVLDTAENVYPTSFDSPGPDGAVGKVVPMGFETRESGHILNVTPFARPEPGRVELAFVWEFIEHAGYIPVPWPGEEPVRITLPLFLSHRLTQTMEVPLGSTTVIHLGAASTGPAVPALDRPPRETARVLLLRVELADP